MFRQHAEVLRHTFADREVEVEHVGPTAVAGLVAEPVVDVAVRLAPAADENVILALEGAGYVSERSREADSGLRFVAEDQSHRRIAQLYVLAWDDPQWERYAPVQGLPPG